mmetsp:Transcript_17890/g.49554  ORF Transcript_17890/g.49554 Transcript_17890/m.49554 type:complete len:193 (-) Transcript_17890:1047-1625(-)
MILPSRELFNRTKLTRTCTGIPKNAIALYSGSIRNTESLATEKEPKGGRQTASPNTDGSGHNVGSDSHVSIRLGGLHHGRTLGSSSRRCDGISRDFRPAIRLKHRRSLSRAHNARRRRSLRNDAPKQFTRGRRIQFPPLDGRLFFEWHRSVRSSLTKTNWNKTIYLILSCMRDRRHCGGVSDRLKPLPLIVF